MNSILKRLRRVAPASMALAALAFSLLPMATTHAAVANTLSFQGRLLTGPTTPAANTTFEMRFSLWANADFVDGVDRNAGALVGAPWQEVQTVTTDSQGFFISNVGSVTALPTVFDSNLYQYLQAEVKPQGQPDTQYFLLDTMAANSTVDRKSISNSVYAQNAARLDGRKLGFGAGDIPFLDPVTGKLDRTLMTDDSWLDPVADEAALGAITASDGDVVFVQSTARIYTYDGSTWIKTGGAIDGSIASLEGRMDTAESDIDSNTAAISAETTRATAAESTLTTDLNTEVTRATAAESVLSGRLTTTEANTASNLAAIQSNDGELATLNSDVNTAGSVLKSIKDTAANAGFTSGTGLVATTLGSAIDEVNTNLSNAIQGLSWKSPVTNVSDLTTTYPSPVSGDTAYVTSLGEIYTYNGTAWVKTGADFFQDGDTSNKGIVQFATDGEIAALKAVQSNDSRLAQVGINTTNITTNASNIAANNSNISVNAAGIITEQNRAETAEQANANAITTEQTRAEAAEAANEAADNAHRDFSSTGFDVFVVDFN